jgi:hypothetical protein
MNGGQPFIVIQNPRGELLTINFTRNYVKAVNREAKVTFDGDSWTVKIAKSEFFEAWAPTSESMRAR